LFFDASAAAHGSQSDGVHLDSDNHEGFVNAQAEKYDSLQIRGIAGKSNASAWIGSRYISAMQTSFHLDFSRLPINHIHHAMGFNSNAKGLV
jgi:hypothetical protein